MKNNSKKTGAATNGRIEYTNNVKSVSCNCRACFHSKKTCGTIYCTYYDKLNPQKKRCVRFSPKENYGPKKDRPKAPIKSTYVPTFPWEMP